MKRTIPAILAITLFLFLISGCSSVTYKAPLSAVRVFIDNNASPVPLSEDAQTQILSMLNNGDWTETVPNCLYDFSFNANGRLIKYHSCGTFYDVENRLWMKLTDEQTDFVNKALGVDIVNARTSR
ncbi:MAG: hypothetical protein J6Q53_08570 [Oscillospiraceae bacterium]|nr:hypothetical protein [Oscillospiraceae bacterium]